MIVRTSVIEELKKPIEVIKQIPDWKEMLKTQLKLSDKKTHTYKVNGYRITARCTDSTDPTAIREIFIYKCYTKYVPLEKKDIVMDIGAHIGCFSVLAGSICKKVFAFEPWEESYTLLRINVKNNALENVECFKKAVTDKNTKYVKFFLHKKWNGCNSTIPVKGFGESIQVENQNLHEFLETNKISFVKMDIEGGEYELIPVLIEYEVPKMVFELHKIHGHKPKELVTLLQNKGYNILVEKQWLPRPKIIHAWRE